MELTWGSLIFVLLAAAIAWFWQDSLRAREAANAAAMESCARLGLQFLDGTVAFAALRWRRDGGALKLSRTYIFDYTAQSIDRLQGYVVLLGADVETVGFASDPRSAIAQREQQASPDAPASDDPQGAFQPTASRSHRNPPLDGSAKVLKLEDWRRAREQRR